jgi:two-component system chemotaxis response regulator CheB
MEVRIASQDQHDARALFEMGELSPFTCPECEGVMAAIKDGNRVRYRCHTGHAFSADSLLAALTEKTEDTLWKAVKEMQETAMLLNHVGDHFAENNRPHEAAVYFQKAKETLQRSQLIRTAVIENEQFSIDTVSMNEEKAGQSKQAS